MDLIGYILLRFKGEISMNTRILPVRNMYTGPGGGAYTGPDSNPYRAIHPPWPLFARALRESGRNSEALAIENALNLIRFY